MLYDMKNSLEDQFEVWVNDINNISNSDLGLAVSVDRSKIIILPREYTKVDSKYILGLLYPPSSAAKNE